MIDKNYNNNRIKTLNLINLKFKKSLVHKIINQINFRLNRNKESLNLK